jgi:hypothetical protein
MFSWNDSAKNQLCDESTQYGSTHDELWPSMVWFCNESYFTWLFYREKWVKVEKINENSKNFDKNPLFCIFMSKIF